MPIFTIHEAKTNLSELIRRVEAGEEIIIARGDEPVAVLKPTNRSEIRKRRTSAFGLLAGKFKPASDEAIFAPLTLEEIGFDPDDPADLAADRPSRLRGKAKRKKSQP